MAAPTVSASLDKPAYAKGDRMTLTVTYGDPDHETVQVTVKVKTPSGESEPVTVSAVVDPLTVELADTSGRSWTRVSDTGTVAVFTATA